MKKSMILALISGLFAGTGVLTVFADTDSTIFYVQNLTPSTFQTADLNGKPVNIPPHIPDFTQVNNDAKQNFRIVEVSPYKERQCTITFNTAGSPSISATGDHLVCKLQLVPHRTTRYFVNISFTSS